MSNLIIDAVAAAGSLGQTRVRIELTDGRGDPVIGYVTGTDETIVSATVFTTDDNGQLTIDVVPNNDITPGNTAYTVTVADKSFLIQKSGATQNLFEALVTDTGPLDPISTDFLLKQNNLSDVDDAETARFNLGLGNSAMLDVGITAGTVAAGDDARFDTIITDHADLTGLTGTDVHPASSISAIPTGFLTSTDVQGELTELAAAQQAHIDNPVDAHDASAISVVPTPSLLSTDVQAALEELQLEIAGGTGTNDHNLLINRDAADQHPASSVTNTPAGSIAATDVQGAIDELDGDIQGHIVSLTDAHDASAISVVPFATIAATDVQAALEEVFSEASGSPAASTVSFVPTGDIAATNVQDAIVEVDGELHAHETDTTDAHDASAISFAPAGDIVATDVQAAIVEVDGELHAHETDTVDAHDATAISTTTFGTITATDVQNALEQVYASAVTGLDEASEISFVPTDTIAATNVQDAVVEALTDGRAYTDLHIADTVDAHDASAISFVPGSGIAATTAQAAIEEAKNDSTAYTDLHIADTTAAHLASSIGFTPTGSISSTTAQAAIAEVSADIDAHIVDTTAAHNASAIGFFAYGNLGSSSVQSALQEVNDEFVQNNISYAGASTDVLRTRVTSDTQPRFTVNADGALEWGAGSATADTNLYRSSTDVLKTDNTFVANRGGIASGPLSTELFRVGPTGGSPWATSSTVFGAIYQNSNSGTGSVEGQYTVPATAASGAVSYLLGYRSEVRVGAAASVGNAYNYYINQPSITAGGSVGTAYGLYINAQKVTGVTTGYGINQAGSNDINFFAGTVQISNKLTLDGSSEQLLLNNGTSNWIKWRNAGAAPPSFTTRSAGTKLVIFDGLSASAADYALGLDSFTFWASVPDSSSQFKWYAGTTLLGTLSGAGALTTTSTIQGTKLGLGTAPTANRVQLVSGTTAADGIAFGSDANLYRSAADILKTDDSLHIANQAGIGVAPSSSARLTIVSGTTAADGILFGSDTTLYRSAADTLKTDDTFVGAGIIEADSAFRFGSSSGPTDSSGTGSPEGVVTAPVGSTFRRTDGSTGNELYFKGSGSGNTGWVVKPDVFVGTSTPSGTPAAGDFWYDTDETNTGITASQVALTTVTHLSSTDVQDAISRMPKGLQGRVVNNGGSSTTISASTTVTTAGFPLSFTPNTLRAYEITCDVTSQIAVAGGSWSMYVNVGGTNIALIGGDQATATATYNLTPTATVLWLPSSSSTVDITIRFVLNSGATPSLTYFNSSTVPWIIMVKDIGLR